MQNLKFNQLLVLSNSEKSANVFQFQERLNLITANDNNVGKSTLVKLLFWALGCEPVFDTTWNNLDCSAIVKFTVDKKNYSVCRYKNMVKLREGNLPVLIYTKITGEYAERFSEIVDFKALLGNRDNSALEVPPPAYYFLPYYIDQKKSWAKPWDSFDSLAQYAEWKVPIVKYHTGLLSPKHFEIETDKYEKKGEQRILIDEIRKLDIAITIVKEHTPKLSAAITTDERRFKSMTDEIKIDLIKLATEQELIMDNLATFESEKVDLQHQKNIAEAVINELELDYKFSVENLENDNIECPLCGTIHQNTAVQRASILVDKQQAESQIDFLNGQIEKLSINLANTYESLHEITVRINFLNEKYVLENDQQEEIGLTSIIESIAGTSIQEKVSENKKDKLLKTSTIDDSLKELNKDQKDLQSKELTDNINGFFASTFSDYAKRLNTEEVNLSAINSPLDYNKVVKEGGAAENVRVTLAYNLAIYSLVEKFSSSIKSAFVLDTPNQHEQSDTNYDSIIKLILETFPKDVQIILCAMENTHLEPYQKIANVIKLDDKKLLDKSRYEEVKIQFDSFN